MGTFFLLILDLRGGISINPFYLLIEVLFKYNHADNDKYFSLTYIDDLFNSPK